MLARLAVRSGRSRDLEIIVLRHQLAVLRRQIDRPALSDDDPTLLGAIAAALPRPYRGGWIVTPDTNSPTSSPSATTPNNEAGKASKHDTDTSLAPSPATFAQSKSDTPRRASLDPSLRAG